MAVGVTERILQNRIDQLESDIRIAHTALVLVAAALVAVVVVNL